MATTASVAPADFLGLQAIGLLLRCHGGLRGIFRQLRILVERLRHQRRGLRRGGKGRDSGGSTNCDLEKFPPFHFFLLQLRASTTHLRFTGFPSSGTFAAGGGQ
jgi:hypothetical protein